MILKFSLTFEKDVIDTNKNEFEETEDIYDALGGILIDLSDGEKTNEDIKILCSTFLNIIQSYYFF